MSGYAGVFHFDGAPVDPAWLRKMADFLAFRGPDGSQVWFSGSAGLCHTLLRTSKDTDGKPQILSLDGSTWIAGDVRVDDRATLIAKLPGDSADLRKACSAELILHAYAKWGEACVEHLLGDFSFVIWDSRERKVFGARDHLGVKPFYYARIGQCLIVSNTLDCIRQVPIVPSELNERAIGDYLIFGENKDPDTTFFSTISQLPVARRMRASAVEFRVDRYWVMPVDEPLDYKRTSDYTDQFLELLRTCVRDRLPDGPLGVQMSGGLDSPALAAISAELGASVTAFTSVFDRLTSSDERHYAALVGQYVGIPICYNVRDDEPYGWEPGDTAVHTPEPWANPMELVATRHFESRMAAHSRVFLCGYGPDDALHYEWQPYLKYLSTKRKWGRLGWEIFSDFYAQRRIPFFSRLPRMWGDRRFRGDGSFYETSFPEWIDGEFATKLSLQERIHQFERALPTLHPRRPQSFAPFMMDLSIIGGLDADCTQTALEFRHPFWDVRIQRYFLAVPPVPWARNKYLMRAALRGILPPTVLARPKTPAPGLPYFERGRAANKPTLPTVPELAHYVDLRKVPAWPGVIRKKHDEALRVLGLQYWFLGL